jgi:predicted GTPase
MQRSRWSSSSRQARPPIRDLEATIEATPCDAIVSGTPTDITRVIQPTKPTTRVRYTLEELDPGALEEAVRKLLG